MVLTRDYLGFSRERPLLFYWFGGLGECGWFGEGVWLGESGGFAGAGKGGEEGVEVGFAGVKGDGNSFGVQVTDDVLHALLKGDILHNLVTTALAMEVAVEKNRLLARFFGR